MTVVRFLEIGITRKKSGPCAACGKLTSRSKRFFQTQSPFNVGPAGMAKSVEDIKLQNETQASAWMAEPVFHVKCQ
jgi:hypothetical protein